MRIGLTVWNFRVSPVFDSAQTLLCVELDGTREARGHGGGHAPDGQCGALHAALTLAPAEVARGRVRERFVSAASSDKCREVRKAAKISCEECVSLAARILHEALDGGQSRGASAACGEATHADRL